MNSSRYLFLEFIEEFSLILVGNQGGHDLNLFKVTNSIDFREAWKYGDQLTSKDLEALNLERVYIYKHNDNLQRILGVNVQRSKSSVKIYIFGADMMLNCVEIK